MSKSGKVYLVEWHAKVVKRTNPETDIFVAPGMKHDVMEITSESTA